MKTAASMLSENVMVLTTDDVRRQLKVISALTGSTMKEVLARLVAAEFKKLHQASGGKS